MLNGAYTVNEDINRSALDGQGYIGYLNCSYEELVDAFGEPFKIGSLTLENKIDVEWDIKFQDGTYLHIYNWKNGKNYLGNDGLEVIQITKWNVGGHSEKDLEKLQMVFPANKISKFK